VDFDAKIESLEAVLKASLTPRSNGGGRKKSVAAK
jgi:hypothetical protein